MNSTTQESGSEIVVTGSYQASIDGFCRYAGVTENEALDIIKRSVTLAREACDYITSKTGIQRLVAGSVGPYGAAQHDGSEYTGKYIEKVTKQELIHWHRPRLKALVEAGCDIIAVETIPALAEAEAIIELLKEFPTQKAWVTFSCGNGLSTHHGEKLCGAVNSVICCDNVVAVGINCTSPEYISPLLQSIQHLKLTVPVIVKPNSGEQWESGKGWYGRVDTPLLTRYVPEWLKLGATWFGGCCRVFPSDMEDMKRTLESLNKQ